LVRLLDRPGGRFLLARIATHVMCRSVADVEIMYKGGLWTRRAGCDFFPDGPRFEYEHGDFSAWKTQMDRYVAGASEFWLRHYQPKEGDLVVDIGAGRGEDTFAFSRGVGKTGRVIAIEAHPLSFAVLKSFCSLNGIANVTALHLALMDKPGTVRIEESESIWSANAIAYDGAGVEVRADTFEHVFREQSLGTIDFLKMNIEGAERYALPGMASLMPRIRQICVACHDFRAEQGHGEQFRTREFVEQFLSAHGFTLSRRSVDQRDYVRDHVFGLRPA